MLISTNKVRSVLESLIQSRTAVSVYCGERFSEVVFAGIDHDLVFASTKSRLTGKAVFTVPPYHFVAEVIGNVEVRDGFHACVKLPDQIVLAQRRRFPRRTFRPDVRVSFELGQDQFRLVNLSMNGMETESGPLPFEAGAELRNLRLVVDGRSLVFDARVCRLRIAQDGRCRAAFEFHEADPATAASLTELLSREELWEPSDFSMST